MATEKRIAVRRAKALEEMAAGVLALATMMEEASVELKRQGKILDEMSKGKPAASKK